MQTDAPVVADKPVAGVHAYEVAPPAIRVVPDPTQIATSGETVTVGLGLTVTVICAVVAHCPAVGVKV